MADEVRDFFRRIQLRPNVISGHVSGVTINKSTGQQEYATVVVGGNTLRIKVDPFAPPLGNGDQVRLEQYGYAASAEYRLAGVEAGARPASGSYQVLNDGTQIGGAVYAGGDFITGQLAGGNVFAEYATGRLYHRIGTEVYGIEYPNGSQLFGHAIKDGGDYVADGPNVFIAPTGIQMRLGLSAKINVAPLTITVGDTATGKGNVHIDATTGRLFHRMGTQVHGIEYPDGSQLFGHATAPTGGDFTPDGPNVYIASTGVHVRVGTEDAIRLLADGTAWMKGDVWANSLRIGVEHGSALLGGKIAEYDANGQPLTSDAPKFGLRIIDETGRPRISLLTGTSDAPRTPALMLGAQDDANYLWYTGGKLRVKGSGWIDEGQIGGFSLSTTRLKSLNNRVILVNEADLVLAEGLLLITGPQEDAGVIAWRKSDWTGHETVYTGIVTNYRAADAGGVLQQHMLLGVSNQTTGIQNPEATFRIECSTPWGTSGKTYLQLQHRANLLQTNARLQVKAIDPLEVDGVKQPLEISGLKGSHWLGLSDFAWITTGSTAAGYADVAGQGIYANTTNSSMLWGLRLPQELARRNVRITQLSIDYKTNTAAAYIYRVMVYCQLPSGAYVELDYTDHMGEGTTGYESRQLLEDRYISIGPNFPYMIRCDITGVVNRGDIIIYGFKVDWEQE